MTAPALRPLASPFHHARHLHEAPRLGAHGATWAPLSRRRTTCDQPAHRPPCQRRWRARPRQARWRAPGVYWRYTVLCKAVSRLAGAAPHSSGASKQDLRLCLHSLGALLGRLLSENVSECRSECRRLWAPLWASVGASVARSGRLLARAIAAPSVARYRTPVGAGCQHFATRQLTKVGTRRPCSAWTPTDAML